MHPGSGIVDGLVACFSTTSHLALCIHAILYYHEVVMGQLRFALSHSGSIYFCSGVPRLNYLVEVLLGSLQSVFFFGFLPI